ncbi:MAG: hypothetical protein KDJ16_18130 [Hyphomicrobiales bacterium]|nr:hypothetical protein [Hyphomicrobiales bacterium]
MGLQRHVEFGHTAAMTEDARGNVTRQAATINIARDELVRCSGRVQDAGWADLNAVERVETHRQRDRAALRETVAQTAVLALVIAAAQRGERIKYGDLSKVIEEILGRYPHLANMAVGSGMPAGECDSETTPRRGDAIRKAVDARLAVATGGDRSYGRATVDERFEAAAGERSLPT